MEFHFFNLTLPEYKHILGIQERMFCVRGIGKIPVRSAETSVHCSSPHTTQTSHVLTLFMTAVGVIY
jgi:hypothetical protein